MILIGNGGHAADILAAEGSTAFHLRFDHHRDVPTPLPSGAYIIGINDSHLRAAVADDLRVADTNWVHPNAWIGPGCFIGNGTHVNYGVTMTRTLIGDHSTIAPGVTICGDVTVGDRVFIGAGAVIANLVTIGDDVTIGAGAVVLRDITEGQTVAGVPARPL